MPIAHPSCSRSISICCMIRCARRATRIPSPVLRRWSYSTICMPPGRCRAVIATIRRADRLSRPAASEHWKKQKPSAHPTDASVNVESGNAGNWCCVGFIPLRISNQIHTLPGMFKLFFSHELIIINSPSSFKLAAKEKPNFCERVHIFL